MIRTFALVITVVFWAVFQTTPAQAYSPVNGFVHRVGSEVLLTLNNSTGRYFRLTTTTPETRTSIERLETGDFLTARAEINYQTGEVRIDSIDFVGLRRLIGLWSLVNKQGLMNFRSYSEVNMYSLALPTTAEPSSVLAARLQFKYSLVPGADHRWVMFLSDNKDSRIAFVDIADETIELRFMNSETGALTESVRLQKLVQ